MSRAPQRAVVECLRGVDGLAVATPSVVTIGNFDGLHLGHRALIDATLATAERLNACPTAVIFEPHPREYFRPEDAPPRVFSLREKCDALAAAGLRRILCLRFDRRLAALSADAFIDQVLNARLRARAVIVGDDFRFGAGRGGDYAHLRRRGLSLGYACQTVPTVDVAGARISSTRLRAALAMADLDGAAALLGRRYAMHGPVRGGLKLGRKLGMPTANLLRRRPTALRHGVYAVRACWDGRPPAAGVASLGVRPTLNLHACLLETHLFVPPGDLYGKLLSVEFVAFLRPQERYDDLTALQRQMHADAEQARALLDDAPAASRDNSDL